MGNLSNTSSSIVISSIVTAVGIILVGFVYYSRYQQSPVPSISNSTYGVGPTPTPLAFEELTIPFLRRKKYASTLGALKEFSQTETYTSYITTYLSDGLTIYGYLTIPKRPMPNGGFPAIVFVHGYIPPTQYKTTDKYMAYVNELAQNGFVVFKIDLRGHGQSQGEPGGAYFSSDYVIDTLHAYAALQNAAFINPQKIGLWGHSMAGNITLRSLAVKKEIPAAVIWAGAVYSYVDQITLGINDQSYQPPSFVSNRVRKRQELIQTYGQPTVENPFWQQVAATNYLSELRGAISLHHAINDEVVDIEYSRNLNRLLDQTQVPHELFEYPSGGHNIENPSFSLAMERTVAFFKNYLGE